MAQCRHSPRTHLSRVYRRKGGCMLLRCGSALVRSALRSPARSSALLATMTAPLASAPAAARPLSPTSSLDATAEAEGQPAAKRQRTSNHDNDHGHQPPTTKTPRKRTAQLPYDSGMHLAPMVRIGTLPVRLTGELPYLSYLAPLSQTRRLTSLALKPSSTAPNSFGVQKSSTRPSSEPSVKSTVSSDILCIFSHPLLFLTPRRIAARTGVVSFLKNGRSIFDCHPLEKSRLIFQLGSASPELAVQAMKVIQHDVAGVGLNCGCPKSFSLSGGMGAALLKEPEKLCSVRPPPLLSLSFGVPREAHDTD